MRDKQRIKDSIAALTADIELLDHLIYDPGTGFSELKEPVKRALNAELHKSRELLTAKQTVLRLLG